MTTRHVELEGTDLWKYFEFEFLRNHGVHILGLGQTGSGKTNYKGIRINRWLVKRAGETLYIMDCGKPGEVLPYATFGMPLNFIIPKGCEVVITGSPVPIHKNYVATPEESWDYALKDEINIFTFRYHCVDAVTRGNYTARFIEVIINQVMRGIISIPLPGVLDIDECADIIGSESIWEDYVSQKVTAARVTAVLKKIRFVGLRVHAKDQSWSDVYAAARRQFPFLLLSRSPGTKGKIDCGKVADYPFDNLKREEGVIVFPNRTWRGKWDQFRRVAPPPGMTIRYFGEVHLDRTQKRKKVQAEPVCESTEKGEMIAL